MRNIFFVNYWRKTKEKTSSSILGLHFGHHKSAEESKIATKLQTMFIGTMITTESIIERWTKELLVMLKKLKKIST